MKKTVLFLFIATTFFGCKQGYFPAAVNSPMFEKEKQFSMSASTLINADIQAAYSITDKFYIHGEGSYLLPQDNRSDGFSFLGGLGYYKVVEKSVMELAIGAGIGETEYSYSKYYFQPTIGGKWSNIELGLTPRSGLSKLPKTV